MEIENEFLIATNGEFYYEGVPEKGTYTPTTTTSCVDEMPGTTGEINRIVGTYLTGVQIVSVILAIVCILKGISNMKKNKQNREDSLEESNEDKNGLYGDAVYLVKDGKVRKKSTFGYFAFSGILLFISFIINIVKNFAAKPIIYIYPEKETEVKVKLKNPEKLTCTYPRYKDEWGVLAKPNGDLIDLKNNRKLYALYWEGINTVKPNLKQGFIVEGENVAQFLEEKLEILGLNEREAEEFIVYWLPLMEKNKYNYIRFETIDEINENMGLEITPEPETLIRINMEFKGLRKPFEVEEQQLEKVERKGYTVVEWGGTKL